MNLRTLYKKTSGGQIEQWRIWVEVSISNTTSHGPLSPHDIVTEYGHVGGKMQIARETVREGKNLGKKNATTAKQQALAQAKSEWEMKLSRKGYTDDIAKAAAGENGGAGGIRPMLAKSFDDVGDKLKYPCYAQPKLDGIRCIAVVNSDGSVSLWSREQKPIVAVPSIAEAVKALNLTPGTVLDGELYTHELKDDFEKISSCVRKQYPASDEEQAMIYYHVYDIIRDPVNPDQRFGDRATRLFLFTVTGSWGSAKFKHPKICHVDTLLIKSREELIAYRKRCQENGYEGAMARADEPYQEGKRSAFLLKLKEFLESDFMIIGVEEGVGKMAGCAIFVCTTERGNTPESNFRVKLEGSLDNLKKYLTDESTWKGKKLTVKYFSLTNKNRVPRFPVGKCVRDYE